MKLLKLLETDHDPNLSTRDLFLQNDDLKPVEKARRRWGWLNFVAFWISDAFNINTWQIASSGVQAGLSWWHVWISVWLGYFIAGGFIVLIGRIGAVYHISFPVACRASFGVFGSYWPVLNRVVMAFIWFGVQAWLGGECVQLMIRSIWPQAEHMHNGIASSGTTTFAFMSFFLWWLCVLPLLWFPVHQIRHLFTIKSYLSPIAGIGFLIWTIKKAGGIGPVVHQPAALHGSELGWAFVQSTMNCIANFAALIMNDPDFSRFAKRPSAATWSQLLTIPFAFAITSFIGIIVSSASTVIYGETVWSPLDVLGNFLSSNSGGTRAGVFLIASVFALAQAGCNIAANSVSAGTDLTALFPRFINIRRGSYLCAIVGFAMCPWHLLSSSNQFTTYLSSYTVFLSSIAGVMACDYYLVRKGKLIIEDLYSCNSGTTYMFRFGVSWRAYAAYICGILINIVGFAGSVGASVPIGAIRLFDLNYFCGFIVAGLVYYGLCYFMPVEGCGEVFSEAAAEAYYNERERDEEHEIDDKTDFDETVVEIAEPDTKVTRARRFAARMKALV
uniref:ARAD1A06402p n=1 Tax=Blastobotrys adeninivorans TaxID=409370 RepID=A0A060T337_BLAAD